MNELNQTILNECREEAARSEEWSKEGYEEAMIDTACNHPEKLSARMYVIESKAALLAMDRQAEFFREISGDGWIHEKDETWYKPHDDSYKTELELYNIWREGKQPEKKTARDMLLPSTDKFDAKPKSRFT